MTQAAVPYYFYPKQEFDSELFACSLSTDALWLNVFSFNIFHDLWVLCSSLGPINFILPWNNYPSVLNPSNSHTNTHSIA